MAWNDSGRANLKDLCDSHGVETVEKIILEAIRKKEVKVDEFSIKELWDGFTNYASLLDRRREYNAVAQPRDKREAAGTSAFVKITGELINARVIDGYDTAEKIGPQLVTRVPSKLKKETITGIGDLALPEEVPEHTPYRSQDMAEKYVTIKSVKYGRIIELTEELVFFDQTGQILTRAKQLGEGCAYLEEKTIVEGVQDLSTNVYYPSDTATAVYASSGSVVNLQASNALSASGLEAIMKLAHAITTDSPDTKYALVNLIGKPLLVPVDLMVEAWELANSPDHPETAERARNYWAGKFVPLTSPFITSQSTTTWFWGDFKRAFWWMEVWPLQTFASKPGADDEFNKDIIAKFKARYFGGIGCVDNRWVFKATA